MIFWNSRKLLVEKIDFSENSDYPTFSCEYYSKYSAKIPKSVLNRVANAQIINVILKCYAYDVIYAFPVRVIKFPHFTFAVSFI